jgi:hypothetical protein
MRTLKRLTVLAVVGAVTLAGCGGGTDVTEPDETPSTEEPTDGTEEPTEEPTDDGTETEEPTETESPLEGEAYEGPPIVAGAELAVVGVAHDDVLNVRAAPGTDQDIISNLGPTDEGFTATGDGWMLPSSIWVEIDTGDEVGWVNASFVAHMGTTDDITSRIVDEHGSLPTAETLLELAEIVAGYRATEEPESRVVVSVAPSVGDLGEITIDVVGFGDDSVFAERLHIFATPSETADGGFTLKSVEATTFCGRGPADAEGLCP